MSTLSTVRQLLALTLVSALGHTVHADPTQDSSVSFANPVELKRCEAAHKRLLNTELTRVYDLAFPAYFEYCAGSVWAKRGTKPGGGFGHALGIIHGACIARDTNGKSLVPQKLVQCPGKTVGFSTNASLINQQWVAHEGRNFVLYGNHRPDVALTTEAKQNIRNEVLSRGSFDDVVLNFDRVNNGRIDSKLIEFIDNDSFGTEFAVAAARGQVTCTRVPLTGTNPNDRLRPLQVLLDEVNELNLAAFKDGYKYNGIVNSCVHTPHTALAAVGAWEKIDNQTNPQGFLEVLKNSQDAIAPFNQVLDTYKLGKEMKQAQVENMINRLRKDSDYFKLFKETGWYATQVGTMFDNVPSLSFKNEAFDPINNSPTQLVTYATIIKDKVSGLGSYAKLGVDLWNRAKNTVKAIDPTGKLKCLDLNDELRCLLSDASGPALNLISNLTSWKKDYVEALSNLRAKPFQEQDDAVKAVTAYLETKLQETQNLLDRAGELTAKMPSTPCIDN